MAGLSSSSIKLIAALFAGTSAAAVAGGYLIKDDAGQPIIQSLLSSPGNAPGKPSIEPKAGKQEEVAALPPKEEVSEPVAQEPADAGPELPGFDILRVERDGSVVIAGKASANSKVEIIENGKAVASGKSGPGGDFAIVFDTPLSSGPHELFIRATPADENGESSEPVISAEAGIISIPEKDDKQGEVLAMVQAPGAATRILQQPEAVENDVEKPAGQEAVKQPETEVAKAPEPQPETEMAKAPEAQPEPEVAKAPEPQPETEMAKAPEVQPETEMAKAPEPQPETEVVKTPEPQAEPKAEVIVKAVDVEENKVFIAGTGEPGRQVRIYINDEFKGAAKVNPFGNFLLEIDKGLNPGAYDLRADMLEPKDDKVASRVVVVIDHKKDEPEQVADATPVPAASPEPEPVVKEEPQPMVKTEPESSQQAETAPVKMEAEIVKPATEEVAKAEPETEQAETGEAKPAVAEAAPAPKEETPRKTAEMADAKPQDNKPVVIKTGRSVIIRSGDSLWRISRRMLGQGRKYTTIFSANANKIKDPNLIYPGQVFDVPDAEVAEQPDNQG